jgi:acyl-CoA synthetase (AMP-forming)/AMP-acid ligase II
VSAVQENFATVLEAVADVMADAPAAVQGDRTLTWRDLDARASRLAGHLAGRGIGHDSRVAVGLYNSPEYLETLLAVLKLRAVPVNLNYRYRERELRYVLADSDAAAAVVDASLVDRVTAVRPDLPGLHTVIRVGVGGTGADETGGSGAVDAEYEDAVAAAEPMPRIERGNDGWLVYTGGTTGMPKGVLSRQAFLLRQAVINGPRAIGSPEPATVEEARELAARRRREGPAMVALPAPPLMHSTGMYKAAGTLLVGGTVVFLTGRSYDPRELARLIGERGVTDLTVVGDVFARPLADVLDEAAAAGTPYDLGSLRRVSSAGVVWSGDVKERLLAHCDAVLTDILAASEGGPFAMALTRRGETAVTSRFTLFPGARLIDESGRDVPPGSGRTGFLAAPADTDTRYLGDAHASEATFRMIDGRRHTVPGDLATLEADGSLTFVGRGSRVINTGGEKVHAEEVEQVIATLDGVADVLVVGLPDERYGHRVAAVVATRPGAGLTEAAVADHVGAVLAGYKRPRVVVFVPEVRRSPVGKADLAWARQAAAGGAGEGPAVTKPPAADSGR